MDGRGTAVPFTDSVQQFTPLPRESCQLRLGLHEVWSRRLHLEFVGGKCPQGSWDVGVPDLTAHRQEDNHVLVLGRTAHLRAAPAQVVAGRLPSPGIGVSVPLEDSALVLVAHQPSDGGKQGDRSNSEDPFRWSFQRGDLGG